MTCNECNADLNAADPHTDATYDDHAQVYYCDVDCFRAWADGHFDEVTAYYERMNVQ
ncbi:hypothetical protein [Sporosarcina phage Lietuvens]|nr:hypothetical protein [Sporosarcina phage Lietuvens]